MELSRTRTFIARLFVCTLIFSLAVPLPIAGHAAGRDADANAARVHARLNSAERKAAIARAAEIEAAAREEYAKNEAIAREEGGGATSAGEMIPPPSLADGTRPLALSPSTPHNGVDGKSATLAQTTPEQGQGSIAPLRGGLEGQRPSSASSRPKSITEVLFNAATGMAGLPGLANDRHDPYNPNGNQGLGFHADGTARRADGTTGTNAAGAGYNGKRAASYAHHGAGFGLGYSPYGAYGSGLYANEPGYDPVTGQNFRYGDPTNGGRRTSGQGGMSGYGSPGSLDQFDPARMMLDHGLNYGLGLANSAAEGLFLGVMESPWGGARARFNFMVDWDGNINGEGDVLLPWYDSKYTTVYSQFGARTMNEEDSRDRWIGNFGLGQRWYPYAMNDGTGEDAGNLMLGYNAFFDNDFTRSHQRGGLGIEAQYDWLHLASNYYVPLSSWRNSKDFDGDFVKERAAEGWDIRAKGYLPFYRNVALTGAYTQWYGDNVGMFGAGKLERDPKVWSYGLEYTPIPLVSGFVNQRSTEHGRSDTELGLRFTYNFQMPWADQIRHDKVAELRTVGGSRHEFVDRENRIILEYKAKNNYHVEFMSSLSNTSGGIFVFRIRNGFGNYPTGTMIQVTPTGTTLAEASPVQPKSLFARVMDVVDELISVKAAYAAPAQTNPVVDAQGLITVHVANVSSLTELRIGNQSFDKNGNPIGGGASGLSFAQSSYTVSGGTTSDNTTVQVTLNGAAGGEQINWSITSPGGANGATLSAASSNISGTTASVTVTGADVRRSVTIKATLNSDSSQTATTTVRFGDALPSGFLALFDHPVTNLKNWSDAGTFCSQQGGRLPLVNGLTSYPYTGNTGGSEPVDGFGAFGSSWPNGVPNDSYWSGTVVSEDPTNQAWSITDSGGSVAPQWDAQSTGLRVICVP